MKRNGFTLVEILIVVAIIGILAAIALPNYLEHVRSGHRKEAKADLAELAQFMERYYTENNKYPGATLPFTQSPRSDTAYYTVSLSTEDASPDEFTLTITPTGPMANDRCKKLVLNEKGTYTPEDATVPHCW